MSQAWIPMTQPTLAAIEALDGVTRMTARARQVLVHPGHVPNGLFVIVEGVVVTVRGHEEKRIRAGGFEGLVLVPDPRELDLAVDRWARVEAGTALLFVPRLLPQTDPVARALFAALPVRRVSLQSARGSVPRHRETSP